MSLRKSIEAVLLGAGGDHKRAAVAVCRLLEDEIGLAGNGWFDDDDEMLQLLAGASECDSEHLSVDHWVALADRLESALASRLALCKESASAAALLRELANCTDEEVAAMVGPDATEVEIDAVRKIVLVRLKR